MRYRYDVSGICALCEIPFPLTVGQESREFLRAVTGESPPADVYLRFLPTDTLPDCRDGHREENRLYCELPDRQRIFHRAAPDMPPHACVEWRREAPTEPVCYYLPGQEARLCYSHNLIDLLGLETLFRLRGGLLLHASLIRWRGMGILFSAPSGTGKSTQAELWVRHAGAELLNGDRAGLYRQGTLWRACGLPYAGSSMIYRNEDAPATAIVVLGQAAENRLRPLAAPEALRYLFPECTVHRWDRGFVSWALDTLAELLSAIPVYRLDCRPEPGAVELLKQEILRLEGER